ncbi:hypothetical protein AG1IA_03927 [Rhizoctonia solani AG-1 IA]|uniref:Uncharacterized protein n=1 Tax=Thanatephorus cucumeris (strain AG1-IA) TaxID=983506 RepID=L8X097_THACA|nr:hypothetical protein AG1IA_03927 [Rhizoctonia solani AG-1 IA]
MLNMLHRDITMKHSPSRYKTRTTGVLTLFLECSIALITWKTDPLFFRDYKMIQVDVSLTVMTNTNNSKMSAGSQQVHLSDQWALSLDQIQRHRTHRYGDTSAKHNLNSGLYATVSIDYMDQPRIAVARINPAYGPKSQTLYQEVAHHRSNRKVGYKKERECDRQPARSAPYSMNLSFGRVQPNRRHQSSKTQHTRSATSAWMRLKATRFQADSAKYQLTQLHHV